MAYPQEPIEETPEEESPTEGAQDIPNGAEGKPQRPPDKPLLEEAILIATLLKESGTRR